MISKTCTKCEHEFPATTEYFYTDKKSRDGLNRRCKNCIKLRARCYCQKNRDCVNSRVNDYVKSHRETLLISYKNYYNNNRLILRRKRDEKLLLNKFLVLSHYGGCCAVCGITDPAFLTIDHVNNNGAKHRQSGCGSGFRLYRWLIHNGFPEGFQVLCWNHNWLKHLNSSCSTLSQQRKYQQNLKRLVISHYGGCCAVCGESNIDVLTIDHVNGGGNKHRKEIGKSKTYSWLKTNEFPLGFRVLCFNHNCVHTV